MLSRRNMGRLPLTYPSLAKLNTFVVGVQTNDGKKLYADGSTLYGSVNMLPQSLLVDRAREYGSGDAGEWVNLTGIGKNRANILVEATVAFDGTVSGKIGTVLNGQMAYAYKENYASCKDSVDCFRSGLQLSEATVSNPVWNERKGARPSVEVSNDIVSGQYGSRMGNRLFIPVNIPARLWKSECKKTDS